MRKEIANDEAGSMCLGGIVSILTISYLSVRNVCYLHLVVVPTYHK